MTAADDIVILGKFSAMSCAIFSDIEGKARMGVPKDLCHLYTSAVLRQNRRCRPVLLQGVSGL